MKLCKTQVKALLKVRHSLYCRKTMGGTDLTLSEPDNDRIVEAINHINRAINLLDDVF